MAYDRAGHTLNSESPKCRQQNLHLQNFKQNCFILALLYRKLRHKRANSVDSDEVAHYELPHLDLGCLQGQLVLFLGFLG